MTSSSTTTTDDSSWCGFDDDSDPDDGFDEFDDFNPKATSFANHCPVTIPDATAWRELTFPKKLYVSVPSVLPSSVVVAMHDEHGRPVRNVTGKQVFQEFRPSTMKEKIEATVKRHEQMKRKEKYGKKLLTRARKLLGKSITDPAKVDEFLKENEQRVMYAMQHAKLRRYMMQEKPLKRVGNGKE